MENRTSSRKTRVGLVVSDKMDKTVVVAIADRVAHPLYKKIVKRTYKLKTHDENNQCGIGDRVKVMDDDQKLRENRLSLLNRFVGVFANVADFGQLSK